LSRWSASVELHEYVRVISSVDRLAPVSNGYCRVSILLGHETPHSGHLSELHTRAALHVSYVIYELIVSYGYASGYESPCYPMPGPIWSLVIESCLHPPFAVY